MSEFTDFFALLSEAETLSQLRGGLERSVTGAFVPFTELTNGMSDDQMFAPDALEKAWAKAAKPAWVKLGLPWNADRYGLDDLAKLGPAVHIRAEEDFSSWGLNARCGGQAFSAAVLLEADRYREATDGMTLFSDATETGAIAACFGLEDGTFRATMIPDGGESFAQAVGITYEQMLDMTLDEPEVGEFTFGFGF